MSLKDEYDEQEEKMSKLICLDDGFIVLKEREYPIPLTECNTAEKILGKICHLSNKNWITVEVLGMFIHIACRENKINIDY